MGFATIIKNTDLFENGIYTTVPFRIVSNIDFRNYKILKRINYFKNKKMITLNFNGTQIDLTPAMILQPGSSVPDFEQVYHISSSNVDNTNDFGTLDSFKGAQTEEEILLKVKRNAAQQESQ
jgi:hypothetical protein